ncbi:cysteine proteinase [Jaminaea rosea]|uniref:Cysteine proteinase n=1 Tax=Jaminaea rosea TaxID=1569628 RepID=A0A316V1Q9_9BASI|nr:cysteine proteinase [Jaminaea rosea]PWN29355.1 cysteine proteinase [Jaminaea rosea]
MSRRDDPDRIVLDYGDCTLRRSDIETVAEGQWINDAVISFYYELLTSQLKSEGSEGVITCTFWQPPAVEILCSLAKEELGPQSSPLFPSDLSKDACIVLPISDRYDVALKDNDGGRVVGTHWSLLVVRRLDNPNEDGATRWISTHYDSSMPSRNVSAAREVSRRLQLLAGEDIGRREADVSENASLPRQEGASDCGLYPLLIADGIARHQQALYGSDKTNFSLTAPQDLFDESIRQLTPSLVRSFRLSLYAWLLRWASEEDKGETKAASGAFEHIEQAPEHIPRHFP